MDIEPQHIEQLSQQRAREIIEQKQQEFIDYVFEESENSVIQDGSLRDTIIDVLQVMDMKGFVVDEGWDGFAPPQVMLPPNRFHDLLEEVQAQRFELANTDKPPKIHTADIYADAMLDDDKGIAVHPNAIIPTQPSDTDKPWLVRYSEGVVTIRFN